MENNSVLFNKETGEIESIPTGEAQQRLADKTHEFPLNDPDGNPVAVAPDKVHDMLAQGYRQPSNDQLQSLLNHAKFSTTEQQVKTGLEGLAQGVAGPLATMAETALGVDPADIRGREETNPGIHLGAEAAGFLAPAIATGGASVAAKLGVGAAGKALPMIAKASKFTLPGLLEHAGVGAAKVAQEAGMVSQIGQDAIKGAFELGLYSGGDEISKAFKEDPTQTATSAMANVGLSSILGGVAGPIFGAIGRKLGGKQPAEQAFVSQMDKAAVESGDFAATIENSPLYKDPEKKSILEGLREQKPNAPEIISAAERLGAPVMEGMTSASKAVQKAEDSLVNGAPTYSGLKRQALYNEGYQKATQAVDATVQGSSALSKAEIGNSMKSSIIDQFDTQRAPVSAMYEEIKASHEVIPVLENGLKDLENELRSSKAFNFDPSKGEGGVYNEAIGKLNKLKTVDEVKEFKTYINKSLPKTASDGEKHAVGVIADGLAQLEDNSVESFAKNMIGTPEQKAKIMELIQQRKVANGFYKQLIEKVQTVADQLGKKKISGVQNAINFIDDLTPEVITEKLFSKKNSEFMSFFAKEFPDQMQMMREYQKRILKEAATKGEDFSLKTFFNKVNELEPEIQKSIFSTEELARIKDAETYIRSFPKDFNPSHTSHGEALRKAFEHPLGAAISNARDMAMEKFIKTFGANPEITGANALGRASVAGYKEINKALKSVLNPEKAMTTALVTVSEASRTKLKEMVDEYTANPEKLLDIGENIAVPEYQAAFAQTAARAVQYLSSLKPQTDPQRPLDSKMKPSKAAMAKYNRAIDLAERPLNVLARIKDGSLTPDDVATIRSVHPDLYSMLSQKLAYAIVEAKAKNKPIPYALRMTTSLFLGQDLDSTMTPQAIMAAQPKQQGQQPMPGGPVPPGGKMKGSMKALSKIPGMYMTPGQARQVQKLKG